MNALPLYYDLHQQRNMKEIRVLSLYMVYCLLLTTIVTVCTSVIKFTFQDEILNAPALSKPSSLTKRCELIL